MISFKEFSQHLLVTLKEHEVIKLIAKIRAGFTTNRFEIKNYTLDEKDVSAYTLFYGYSNYHKLKNIMNLIPKKIQDELEQTDLVDIGSGPGVFSLAWHEYFPSAINFTLYESSNLMQMQAKKLIELNNLKLNIQTKIETKENQTFLFGHSFNEIGVDDSQKLIKKHHPAFVFFIEPGTKEVFSKLTEMRSWLIANDYDVLYPCLSNQECPLMNHDRDWCHQFLTVSSYDQSFESLCQKLKMDRRKLPITVHLYQKKKQALTQTKNQARVIRVFKETKFSFDFELCLADKVVKFQVMKKHYSKSEQKEISQILSGDLVHVELEKNVSDKLWRGKISKRAY